MVLITIEVPKRNIKIDATVTRYPELRHEPASTNVEVNSISVDGLDYKIEDYDVIDIDNLADEREKELNHE